MLDRSSSKRAVLLIAAAVGILCPRTVATQAPELQIPRERVLAVDMRINTAALLTEPASTGAPGVAWTRDLSPTPAVTAIRLFVEVAGGATTDWVLRILQTNGTEIERLTGQASSVPRTVWTDAIEAGTARVEMVRGAQGNAPAVAVRRYAFPVMPTVEQAIHGKDQRLPIFEAPLRARRHRQAIARLRFMIEGQGQATCTGFMVGVRLMMTNEHCISNNVEAQTAIADFNYDSAGSNPTRVRVESLVVSNKGLDYSLLKLVAAGPPSTGRLFFRPPSDPAVRQLDIANTAPLFIIQHPSGLPKQVSIADCGLSGERLAGVQPASQTDFGHTCDTLGGSSGSPVLNWDTGRVVGLHHFGFHPGVRDPVNQAVHVDDILGHIKANAAAEFKEVSAAPGP
ncbi:MAG TPA: serine protease [Vicinamibacterales bacterium]|nr:serine protease [Vicinamibacterales bacterium]